MKKITNFIIDKRYSILVVFILLTIICGILSSKVKINYDMTEYLPSTSETRIGMDIMEEEFSETKTSSLNLMFKGLENDKKEEVSEYLSQIECVGEVEYDKTEKYNKDEYTLYVITVKDEDDSQTATNVYNDISEKYKDYETYTSGNISNKNTPVLELWIIVLAVACALVILIIMCESYTEPFLFLTSILMAVVLNNGTNIIFKNVSNITSSISAILQLALSMDYSIMLMNRYNQEKKVEANKIKAMKNALYNAFKSISSSSITTIVGLLVLIFMSFKIGKDLGFVLAKGVFFSLVSIFFVLPSLILLFDKLIIKTKKKSPNINLQWLGKAEYKCRYIAVPLFLIIFLTSFLLKGNLQILYTNSQLDDIGKVFQENNQIAIIYNNKDEEKVAKYLGEIENNENVTEVLGYGNTINEKLKYNELNNQLNDLGSDVNIDDYLLKILYFNYYNKDESNVMTFDEFVKFIQSEIYNNPTISKNISETTKSEITRLSNFTNSTTINKQRSKSEIANILDISEDNVSNILTYYNSKNNNLKISLNTFINFINTTVLTNAEYANKVDSNSRENLNTLAKFTDKSTIQRKMNYKEMANLFGIDEKTMNSLYTYYISTNSIDTKLTISEFSNFVINDVLTDSTYSNNFDENTIANIKQLSTFSDNTTITKEMNDTEISNLFGINKDIVSNLLLLKYSQTENGGTLTISEFVNLVTYLKNNTHYLDNVDVTSLSGLDSTILSNPNKYTATQLAEILNIDKNQMYQIFALNDYNNGNTSNWTISPSDFVKLILNNSSNPSISSSLDETTISKLNLLNNIMDSSLNNHAYSYEELANFISTDATTTKSIYSLYVANKNTLKITPQSFVNFVLIHKNDEILSKNLNNSTINELNLVKKVMDGVINNKTYTTDELSSLLGINKDNLDLIYGLYVSKYVNPNQTMSLKDFVNFLLQDVITNADYSSSFDEDSTEMLNTINSIMNSSLNNVKYNKEEIFVILSTMSNKLDKNTVDLIYMYYGSDAQYDDNWSLTVEEFVNYINGDILEDDRFSGFIKDNIRNNIVDSKGTIDEAKQMLVGDNYSRIVINTTFSPESEDVFEFIQNLKDRLGEDISDFYVIGDSPMAYEMSKTFNGELNYITVLTMVAIFVVVALTFKSIIIPLILVLTIQCAVYMTMGIMSFSGEGVYFISILIVQSILMGATIDYAILYTSYYLEHRKMMDIKEAIIQSYNKSIHTILTSASILIIVTLIVGNFASAMAAQICRTISEGTLCSSIIILVLLPAMLATFDRFIVKRKK